MLLHFTPFQKAEKLILMYLFYKSDLKQTFKNQGIYLKFQCNMMRLQNILQKKANVANRNFQKNQIFFLNKKANRNNILLLWSICAKNKQLLVQDPNLLLRTACQFLKR